MSTKTADTGQSGPDDRTIDADEIAQFDALADLWWDTSGPFKPLHKFNPVRLEYLRDRLKTRAPSAASDPASLTPLAGLTVLDIGCGGGLIAEPLTRMGATVTAIDASAKNIGTAKAHARRMDLDIDYRAATAAELVEDGLTFDVVVSLEVVEHVADIGAFVSDCAALTRPDGCVLMATLNRTAKSFLFGIVGAEYVLRWLPRGTHDWRKFVRPSELARHLKDNGLSVTDMSGVSYDLLTDTWRLSRDTNVNYLMMAEK